MRDSVINMAEITVGDAAGSIDGGDCLERVAKGAVFADKKRLAAAVRQQLRPLARHRVALQVRRSDGKYWGMVCGAPSSSCTF